MAQNHQVVPTMTQKLSSSYDKAKVKPAFRVNVYPVHSGIGPDKEYRARRRKELVAEIEAHKAKIKNFDRDKAADTVLGALMRSQKQAELDLERHDSGDDSGF